MGKHKRTVLEEARDRLFAEIHRCGVPGATVEDARAWLDDTIDFLAGQYPALTDRQCAQLARIGRNYLKPAIPHGASKNATNRQGWAPSDYTVMSGAV